MHLFAGLLGFVAFVVTGQYLELARAHLPEMPDAPRLMYRSAHIYVLYAALLNLVLATYLKPLSAQPAKRLQVTGSLIILVVPVLLVVSFFAESHNDNSLSRPVGVVGIYLSLLGVALHLFAAFASREGRGGT